MKFDKLFFPCLLEPLVDKRFVSHKYKIKLAKGTQGAQGAQGAHNNYLYTDGILLEYQSTHMQYIYVVDQNVQLLKINTYFKNIRIDVKLISSDMDKRSNYRTSSQQSFISTDDCRCDCRAIFNTLINKYKIYCISNRRKTNICGGVKNVVEFSSNSFRILNPAKAISSFQITKHSPFSMYAI